MKKHNNSPVGSHPQEKECGELSILEVAAEGFP